MQVIYYWQFFEVLFRYKYSLFYLRLAEVFLISAGKERPYNARIANNLRSDGADLEWSQAG